MSVSQSWFGPSAVSSCPVPLVLVGHRAQIILGRWARASCHCPPCFFPNPDHQLLLDAIRHIVPSPTPCHPPHRAIRHTGPSHNTSPPPPPRPPPRPTRPIVPSATPCDPTTLRRRRGPCRRATRCPNPGSSLCASNSAFARSAPTTSLLVMGSANHR